MSAAANYPNNTEVRQWAMSKSAGHHLSSTGRLPRYVIIGWNRAHPDRPYVEAEAYHGTIGGYTGRACRCDRCLEIGRANARERDHMDRDERDDALADDLLDGAR